jgi:acyl carrier protein
VDRREIEDLIIGLLAEDAGANPADLREQLEDLGDWLPIDSLLAVEVLARVEEHYGVTFPTTPEAAKNLTSVTAFAEAILDAVRARGAMEAGTA